MKIIYPLYLSDEQIELIMKTPMTVNERGKATRCNPSNLSKQLKQKMKVARPTARKLAAFLGMKMSEFEDLWPCAF